MKWGDVRLIIVQIIRINIIEWLDFPEIRKEEEYGLIIAEERTGLPDHKLSFAS